MTTTRGAGSLLLVLAAVGGACGGGGARGDAGSDGAGGATGAAGAAGADDGVAGDGAADGPLDLATDFGEPPSDAPVNCPTGAGTASETGALIDDFKEAGPLDGRQRQTAAFTVKEQFDATQGAKFDPRPRVEGTCGALTLGAAHIRGAAADTGATFALVFAGKADGGTATAFFDASGTSGLVFYAGLGDVTKTKLFTVQVNLADSKWDYTKDVIVDGTAWQKVEVRWSELQAGAGAPAFSAAKLNQIVFPLIPNADVDVFLDDLAFLP